MCACEGADEEDSGGMGGSGKMKIKKGERREKCGGGDKGDGV